MNQTHPTSEELASLDIAHELGAETHPTHVLTVYIPSHDRNGNPDLDGQKRWTLSLGRLLSELAGGVTIMPKTIGAWVDPSTDNTVWETPVMMRAHVRRDVFEDSLLVLRSALHDMGRDLKQGAIAFEVDNSFYTITNYDEKENAA